MGRRKFHFWISNLYFKFSRVYRTLYHRLKIEDGKNPKCCRSRKAPAGTTFIRPNLTNNSAFRKIFSLNESQVIIIIYSVFPLLMLLFRGSEIWPNNLLTFISCNKKCKRSSQERKQTMWREGEHLFLPLLRCATVEQETFTAFYQPKTVLIKGDIFFIVENLLQNFLQSYFRVWRLSLHEYIRTFRGQR